MDAGRAIPRVLFVPLAAAVLYVCFFSGLNNLGLVGPDEPRYAWVAREMAESGDWVTPRLYGEPWFEKPVLYYWGAAAAFRVFGVNEFAARLPSALAALLATLALAALARRLYGKLAAQFVVLMLPTCVGMFGFARAATTDMLFSAALTLAMACATVLVGFPAGTRPERYWLLLFGGALGLGMLAKGPAAIVLAAGSVFFWVIVTRKWREAFRLARPETVVAVAVVALPWYVECALRNPDFLRVFFIAHNFERFLTPIFQHQQPFWFYGPILLLGLLPWTVLLLGSMADGIRAVRERTLRDSSGFFLACWAVFPIFFFSISKSKLPGYILPAIPTLVLLLARSLAHAIEANRDRARWLTAAVGATFVALALFTDYWLLRSYLRFGDDLAKDAAVWVTGFGVGGAVVLLLGFLKRPRAAAAGASLLLTLIVAAILAVLAYSDSFFSVSPRALAREAAAIEKQGETVYAYRLHRAWYYGLNFYLHRRVEEWSPDREGSAVLCTSWVGERMLSEAGREYRILQEPAGYQALLVRVEPKEP